ncbi:MAG: HAD-IA family hydrolase [Deltaproteobacteria bacterium]|nr:HAD-IA family hydrolase [Deltaproteobacteria bacterium]
MSYEIDWSKVEILSFDCFGTLIDWETGITDAVQLMFDYSSLSASNDEILEAYARIESELEAESYRPYAEILRSTMRRLGTDFGYSPDAPTTERLVKSLPRWPAFDDTVPALKAMEQKGCKLAAITNCDNDLFGETIKNLGVGFDFVVTAEDARAYKPDVRVFHLARERFNMTDVDLREAGRWVHVAQSRFHDIAPANKLNLPCVWVDRRHDRDGHGATSPSEAKADLRVESLSELVEVMGAA